MFFLEILTLFRDGRDAPRTRTRPDAFVLRAKISHPREIDAAGTKRLARERTQLQMKIDQTATEFDGDQVLADLHALMICALSAALRSDHGLCVVNLASLRRCATHHNQFSKIHVLL